MVFIMLISARLLKNVNHVHELQFQMKLDHCPFPALLYGTMNLLWILYMIENVYTQKTLPQDLLLRNLNGWNLNQQVLWVLSFV